jgi:hypothetical protein
MTAKLTLSDADACAMKRILRNTPPR